MALIITEMLRGVAQRPVGDALEQHAERRGRATIASRKVAHQGRSERRGGVEGEVGAQHEHVAVGEVDEPEDAVHHRVADGDERVEAAQGQGVRQVLQEEREASCGLGAWSPGSGGPRPPPRPGRARCCAYG